MRFLKVIKKSNRIEVTHIYPDGWSGSVNVNGWKGSIIASTNNGWEHVSVAPYRRNIIRDDMCKIKEMCFEDEEAVYQIHPAKSQYVNNVSNCLHLWRYVGGEMPLPPSILVGIKDGQNAKEVVTELIDKGFIGGKNND